MTDQEHPAESDHRLIERGACSWCGKPHPAGACVSTIRTAEAENDPCRCPRDTTH